MEALEDNESTGMVGNIVPDVNIEDESNQGMVSSNERFWQGQTLD